MLLPLSVKLGKLLIFCELSKKNFEAVNAEDAAVAQTAAAPRS